MTGFRVGARNDGGGGCRAMTPHHSALPGEKCGAGGGVGNDGEI